MARITKEKFKTMHGVFDDFANRTLYKLITEGHLEGIIGPVSIGKEANIFQAKSKEGKVILKIYRLETCDFNRMYDHIKYDPRFMDLKKQKRKIIFAWCQREYRNLLKAREANVKAPIPIAFLNNVLVMELIGDDYVAPKLKDKFPENPEQFFEKIVTNIRNLYKAGLVHSDLSAFNILNHNENPVIIDWSQATPLTNPNTQDYIRRDVLNVANFFRKHGLKIDDREILKQITN